MRSIFFATVFVILFVNALAGLNKDKWFRSKCYWFIPWPVSVCSRRCPKLFSNGRCELYKEKWQCVCRSSEIEMKAYTLGEASCIQRVYDGEPNPQCATDQCPLVFRTAGKILRKGGQWKWYCSAREFGNDGKSSRYTLDEANCIQRVSEGELNPQCATDLCPFGFQTTGEILKEEGEWKWYCSAREFGNDRKSRYTLGEAWSVNGACNDQDSNGLQDCRQLCPKNYKMGDCFLDRHPLLLRCACTRGSKLNEFYGVQETRAIVKVCRETVQNHVGCAELCPPGFDYGRCRGDGPDRYCGCSQYANGAGFYTIPKAREMIKVCNRTRRDHEECRWMCPVGYKSKGRCSDDSGYPECQCMKNDAVGVWIPLIKAINEFDKNSKRSRLHSFHQ